jgi:hypothetical protein
VDGDEAVLGLAQPAAPRFLHAGRLVSLVHVAGLVEEPDGVWPLVLGGDESLEPIPQAILVPLELAEEPLRGAWGDIHFPGDRLNALLGQVGELAADVGARMGAGVLATEAAVELREELGQRRLQRTDRIDVHGLALGNSMARHNFAPRNNGGKANLAL